MNVVFIFGWELKINESELKEKAKKIFS